jgi:translation initiation factor IF-3
MRFKGREQSNKAVGFDTMQEFIDLIPNNLYTVEQQLQDSGKQIIVVLKGIKQ